MARGKKAGSQARTTPSWASWWVLGPVAIALAIGGTLTYLAKSGTPPGPREVFVTEIEHTHGLAVDPTDSRILWIGGHGSLIRVTDGRQWIRVGTQTYDMMGFSVHPTEPNTLLTSGHPGPRDRRPNPLGVEISRDGGLSWKALALAGEADFHAMTISRADPRVIYAWNISRRAGLYRSQDGGRGWEALGDRGLLGVYSLSAHPQQSEVVYAATTRGLYVSVDAGESWRSLSPALAGVPVTAVEVHPRDPQSMYAYAADPELGLIRSADGGMRWSSVGFFLGNRDAIGNLALDPIDVRLLYFATHMGDLYRSRDGGKSREQWVSRGKIGAP